FEREARILASLSHPHIGAIHGIAEGHGIRALVLELIEGPTLAEAIASPARLTLERALAIASQIADALEAAHSRGAVHRDLKPANIKLTANGVVKVLDFGLAKAVALGEDADPTIGATRVGVIAGTIAYMSPEQARGNPVDRRSDIWA